jgi:glycosyltransferase involved in cell wall biosynthesis
MKILFFSHDAELYGASRSLVNLVRGLELSDIDCWVALPYKGPLIRLLEEDDIPYFILPFPGFANYYMTIDGSDSSFLKGQNSFLYKLQLTIRILKGLFLTKQRKFIKSFDILVSNCSVNISGSLFSMIYRIPHIWHIREFRDLDYNMKFIFGEKILAFLFRHSARIVFISKSLSDHYSNYFQQNLPPSVVIYNGLFFSSEFDDKRVLHKEGDKFTFDFSILGNILAEKGQLVAIDAIDKLKDEFPYARLNIVGGDHQQIKYLELYILNKKIPDLININGFIEDVSAIYENTDCLLNCSKMEAFGRTTVEAMAYGIPVIGNNSGGTAEIIIPEITGLLYDNSVDELVKCMRQILMNPESGRSLGLNGWKMAKERFTIEKYSESFKNVLDQAFSDCNLKRNKN